ncbi:ankyrin repeat and death domain-containing protein 1B-like [Schistocerca piceifrons]|uniref:ankyrin repeat and death domain-containing protein 1B-like n=1 Tax=Schistocerca piceifrons TaxID=274613 RepID=UPI001F5FE59B|nr:ankyrin repeat and death domain-containing protein 1B-like [Schistocerca piceifrons]
MAAPAKSVEEQLEEMFASDGEVPGDARASTAAATTVPEDVPETNDDAVVRSRGKKRLRNEDKWLRNVRKERRALGQEYVNRKGNLVPRKELRKISECTCRYECHKHINEEQQEQVFNEFNNLGSHDLQSAFLFTMIKVVDKARSYKTSVLHEREVGRQSLIKEEKNNARDGRGRTPLHRAAERGHAEAAADLLLAGADRGARDDKGRTPLYIARQNRKRLLVDMLRQR